MHNWSPGRTFQQKTLDDQAELNGRLDKLTEDMNQTITVRTPVQLKPLSGVNDGERPTED
jgi:hypothetical protein